MRKLFVILCLSALALTACQKEAALPIEEATPSEVDSVEEQESPDADKPSEFISIRYDEPSGGRRMVSPVNRVAVSDWETFEMDMDRGYRLELLGLEKTKTYRLELKGILETSAVLSLTNKSGNVIYQEWQLDQGPFEFEEAFVFTDTTDASPVLVLATEGTVDFDETAMVRQVGELVFSDEFDYEGIPDPEKWGYEVGGHGWGNGELQYYTGSENTQVSDDHLYITAKLETKGNNKYTSSRMRSLQGFLYGRIEVKAQLPFGYGTWPAIWMMPTQERYGTWPNSGEIDIMEHVGYEMDRVHASVHTGARNFRSNNHPTGTVTVPRVDTEFNVYAVEWTPYQIDFYVNDVHYVTYKNDGLGSPYWPFDGEFYILMNVAVGGAWGAARGIDDSVFPQQLVVDYVRVYDLEDALVDDVPPTDPVINDSVVLGPVVSFDFRRSSDNYLVDYYEVYVDDQLYMTTTQNQVTLYHLKANQDYTIGLQAVDVAGNKSNQVTFEVTTEDVIYTTLPGGISPEDVFYHRTGEVAYEADGQSHFRYLDDGGFLLYAVEVEAASRYVMAVTYGRRIFDSEMELKNVFGDSLALTPLPATPNGDYETLTTEGFYLEKGQYILVLQVNKGGFKLGEVSFSLKEE